MAQDKGFPPLSRTVEVQIDVVDRANNPPVWDHTVYGPIYIRENLPVGAKVVSVKARCVSNCSARAPHAAPCTCVAASLVTTELVSSVYHSYQFCLSIILYLYARSLYSLREINVESAYSMLTIWVSIVRKRAPRASSIIVIICLSLGGFGTMLCFVRELQPHRHEHVIFLKFTCVHLEGSLLPWNGITGSKIFMLVCKT